MIFRCINIHQVPWEVLKTAASGLGFQHLPRDLANANAWKTMFFFPILKNWDIQLNLDDLNTFTWDGSNSFLSPYENPPIAKKQVFRGIFLFYHEIVCCVYSLESADEYTQHTINV